MRDEWPNDLARDNEGDEEFAAEVSHAQDEEPWGVIEEEAVGSDQATDPELWAFDEPVEGLPDPWGEAWRQWEASGAQGMPPVPDFVKRSQGQAEE